MRVLITVFAVILFLVLLIIFSYFKLRIISTDTLTLKAGIGPFMITVYPGKTKKMRLSASKYKKLMKKKKVGKPATDTVKSAEEKPKGKKSVSDLISFLRALISHLGRYIGFFHTKIRKLSVTVGGDDAAAAAIKYGAVLQSAYYVAELLDERTKLHPSSYDNISVRCDFLSEDMDAECDIQMKIMIGHILTLAVKLLILKVKFDSDNKQ